MRSRNPLCIALVLVALLNSPVSARTWRVTPDGSGDAPTIRAAIDSAQAGDEVVLASGGYTWTSQGATGRDMILMKADVTLRSEANDPEAVVLDAEQRGRVIRCIDVQDARIEGLTIRGGQPRSPNYGQGAGIYSSGNSRPMISNCIIRNNRGSEPYYGGGIYCENGTIEKCRVLENSIVGQQGLGGGIFCRGTRITGCLVRDNIVYAGDGLHIGGGIFAADSSTLTDCVIENNSVRSANAGGGGVGLAGASMRDCILINNSADYEGGGVCAFTGEVSNCILVGNKAVRGRGGAASNNGGPLTIVDCTCVGNIAADPNSLVCVGGIYLPYGGTVQSTIIAFNDGAACGGNASFNCTDLYGNTLGDAICGTDQGGNFSADPLFCSADPATLRDVTIHENSPCAPGHHPMGSDCGLIGASGIACGGVTAVDPRAILRTFLAIAAPNPTSAATRVQLGLERRMLVKLGIYDVAGRFIRRLADGPIEAGVHVVDWDGRDEHGNDLAAGVYIARFQSGEKVLTQKIVIAR